MYTKKLRFTPILLMQYFGGKAKISKYIVDYLENVRKENQVFVEPFVGGANIVSKMSGTRRAYDFNEYLIAMYQGVQNGYDLPNTITQEQYKYIKNHKDEDKVLTGFVGFGCSFAGKWFGGYARGHGGKLGYADTSKRSLLKKMNNMKDVTFECADYKTLTFNNCLIYCDPPYRGTTKFTGTPDFNSDEFWNVMRIWSKNNDVYISEYEAPSDFKCVLEISTKTDIRNGKNQLDKRIEKLFTYK